MSFGNITSAIGHVAFLAWALISFSAMPLQTPHTDALAVDVVSISDFSQLTKGVEDAPKKKAPKPLVEKVGERKVIDTSKEKVSDKAEIKATSEVTPPPEPTPPQPEKKPADASPPPKEAAAKPEDKAPAPKDPIAEALKKDEAKPKEKPKKTASVPTPPRRPPRPKPQPHFNPRKVAALLDKRDPRRHAAVGDTLTTTASLGLPSGNAAKLSQTELDALRAQILKCWNIPAGVVEADKLIVVVQILLKQDGSLQAAPALLNRSGHPLFQIAAESAMRAIRRCQPYQLPVEKYQAWRDVEVTFDPRDMYGG